MFEFVWKWAFALLALTYNPTPYNYVNWLSGAGFAPVSMMVFAGLILMIGYIVYLRATLRSIGYFGIGLVLALVSALVWVLYDFDVLSLDDSVRNTWIGLTALSFVLGIGLSWSHVRRRLAGQHDVDDVED
jgi:hypothetical protein